MQVRRARDSLRSRKALFVQIQTAQCRAIGVCKRVQSSEAEGFGRGPRNGSLWEVTANLLSAQKTSKRKASFILTSLPQLQGGVRGLGNNNGDPNRK